MNAVQSFALTLTRTRTYEVYVVLDPTPVKEMRTETKVVGEYELLICGELAFVHGTTQGAYYPTVHYWRAISIVEAREMWKRLRAEGYERSEPKTRVLGFVEFAGGQVWHSWGEGANRCGRVDAPAQIAPVIAYFKHTYDRATHTTSKYLDRISTMYALSPSKQGDCRVSEGDVTHSPWYSYEAARSLIAGEWTAIDPMIAVDSVNDCRKVELQVFC
jgi:hypothetical protein